MLATERKHYPRFSTIYTLVWIHNKIGVRPCDILCFFHFSFPSPFYPIITPLRKIFTFPFLFPFHSIALPLFLSEIYHTIYLLIYTLPETDTKKSPLSPTPLHRKKTVLKVKSSSPPDSTHLPPQVTYSSFPLSADLPFSSTPHHYHHSPLLPQQSE